MAFNLDSIPSQAGKIAIVTGANTGLGYETALNFAKKDITVVIACRNEQKARTAIDNITHEVPGADVEFMALDLSSMASVREFAQNFRDKFQSLDLLVNNAGIMIPPYAETVDGFESQMATNYFGHFLLTSLLLDLMPDSSESRIVSLSSNAHKIGLRRINFKDIHWEKRYSRLNAYCQSKLACLMFSQELHRKLEDAGKKILSVCAHPGTANTELFREFPEIVTTALKRTILPYITHSAEQGALPQIMAALSPDVTGGGYYGPSGIGEMQGKPGKARIAKPAREEAEAKRLWVLSEKLTDTQFDFSPKPTVKTQAKTKAKTAAKKATKAVKDVVETVS